MKLRSNIDPSATTAEVRPLNEDEFRLFQRLIHQEAGIFLGPSKKELLVARLRRRLRARGVRSFLAYHRLVKHDSAERVKMLDCISTNETHFFREPRQFEFLEQHVFPAARAAASRPPLGLPARRRPGLRVWSAGCSSGEEPYSLAMTLLDNFANWPIEILATDLSTQILAKAQAAVWPIERATEIPTAYRKRFMLRGTRRQAGKMKAGPEIRSVVRFERLNLNNDTYPSLGLFDLIFCRNVLIYFNAESREQVIRRLLNHLGPDGILFLGHAESLSGLTTLVRSVGPNTYTHAANLEKPGSRSVPVPRSHARTTPGILDEVSVTR